MSKHLIQAREANQYDQVCERCDEPMIGVIRPRLSLKHQQSPARKVCEPCLKPTVE